MNELLERAESPKKTMPLIFIIDKSGSMSGERIGSVNNAMRNILPMLGEIAENNNDAIIKIAILEFSHDVNWITNDLVDPNNFNYLDIQAGGLTDFGKACLSLNEKLSRNTMLSDPLGYKKPIIIVLSDGAPTDDWQHAIGKLKQNKWFNLSQKFAIAIGHDAVVKENLEALVAFTGSIEGIMLATNVESLKTMITVVSVTASQIGATSQNVSSSSTLTDDQIDEQSNKDTYKAVNDAVSDVDGAVTAADGSFTDFDTSGF